METTDAIQLTVNGEAETLPAGEASIDALLRHLGFDPAQPGLAVAVDETVVRRQDWGETRVKDGDAVELITAQQGG